MKKKYFKTIYRWLGLCLHPAFAIEVFHFMESNGEYLHTLTCGYLCTICMGKAEIPPCQGRGTCIRERTGKVSEILNRQSLQERREMR